MASGVRDDRGGWIYSEPMAIRKVVLRRREVDNDAGWGKPRAGQLIADWVAAEVTEILEDNISGGTGVGAAIFGRPAGGKTGTTENHADAWFSGYHAHAVGHRLGGLSAGPDPDEERARDLGRGRYRPATIWNLFMRSTIGNTEPVDFPEPTSEPEWRSFEQSRYADEYYDDDDYTPYYSPSPSPEPTPPPPPRDE